MIKNLFVLKLILFFFIIFGFISVTNCSAVGVKLDNADIYSIKAFLSRKVKNVIEERNLPSVTIALVDDQEQFWKQSFGYANIKHHKKAEAKTIYRAASISKVITGVGIMKLYNDGLIDIEAPLTDYLPDFSIKSRYENSSPITIKSLMTHRSGLPRDANIPPYVLDPVTIKDVVDSLKTTYQSYPVNYRAKYSNAGLTVLGRVIEVVTGQSFNEYMKENILNPIGMTESTFHYDDSMEERVATGYHINSIMPTKKTFLNYLNNPASNNMKQRLPIANPIGERDLNVVPAGNLFTTIDDLTAFMRFVFNEGEVGDNQIIEAEVLKKMYVDTVSTRRDPTPTGLVWWITTLGLDDPPLMVHHSGEGAGFNTLMVCMPEEKLGVLLLCNSDGFIWDRYQIAKDSLRLLYQRKHGIYLEEKEDKYINLDTEVLDKYCGRYSVFGTAPEVFRKDDTLFMNYILNLELKPLSENSFRVDNPIINNIMGKLYVDFFCGEEGKEDLAVINLNDVHIFNAPKVECYNNNAEPVLIDDLKGLYRIDLYNNKNFGQAEIKMKDGMFVIDTKLNIHNFFEMNFIMPVKAINNDELLIVGGDYDRETITYNKKDGTLFWEGFTFVPNNK